MVLAAGLVVTASVAMAETLSLPERVLGVSFACIWIALVGMTVKVWGEPQLRGLYFANPIGSKLARMKRFLARYRERFGPDLWSTLFIWSAAVALLSALFVAATKK